MEGIIVKYVEDKRYGFIKDENDKERFFHISNIENSERFLENIFDYSFEYNEGCFIVEFDPLSNDKGLAATKIILTKQACTVKKKKKILNSMNCS